MLISHEMLFLTTDYFTLTSYYLWKVTVYLNRGICGIKSGNGTGFSPNILPSPHVKYHATNGALIYLVWNVEKLMRSSSSSQKLYTQDFYMFILFLPWSWIKCVPVYHKPFYTCTFCCSSYSLTCNLFQESLLQKPFKY